MAFEKNANLFAENCKKSQKIVIITSTPDVFCEKIAHIFGLVYCIKCIKCCFTLVHLLL
jgi:phosphoserine phosphatase